MEDNKVIRESVDTLKSFSKKKQQVELYIADGIKASGGGQGCYNIPKVIFLEMQKYKIIKEINLDFTDKNTDQMTSYTLREDYTFVLSDRIKRLIDYTSENEGILLVKGSGTKIQINRRRCNDLKELPDTGHDLEWFVKLYDTNPRPSKITYILDKNLKTLKMDIEIKYDLNKVDNKTHLISEEPTDYNKEQKLVLEPSNFFNQKILFGPPGTGKSFNTSKEILNHQINVKLIPENSKAYDSEYVYRTTIYPEYSYYDFIGSVMPTVEDENITYDFKPGTFTLALAKALEVSDRNVPVYLVIEELSRGNIASIFGDVFQLLDRKDGKSEYEIDNEVISKYLSDKEIVEYAVSSEEDGTTKKEIYLPHNLNILGTFNTSDQNVFVMDTAFKRRFEFEYVDIDPVKDKDTGNYLNELSFTLDRNIYSWTDFYQELNTFIVDDLQLPEDKQVGQFFVKFDKNNSKENYKQIQNKLLQYLWEDIHLINITENSLFKTEYKTFSKLYKDFGKHINVFNDKFIRKLSKEE